MQSIRSYTWVAAALLVTTVHAQSTRIRFDSLASGDAANLAAPSFLQFNEGVHSPDLDADGDVIPGSDRWRILDGAQPIVVRDPLYYDRGVSPSGGPALDSVFQPTLINFTTRQSLTEFSVTLDNDGYGDPNAVIQFYSVGSAGNSLLASIPIDQTVPGFIAKLAQPVSDVDMVVLPSGALYDNISLSVVPEPGTQALAFVGAGALGWLVLRRKNSVAR